MKKYLAITSLILAASLQGCGSSVLIKQEAGSSVTAGKSATTEINKFYDQVFNKQIELAASLLARYPTCKYGESIIVRSSYNGTNSLCLSSAEIRQWQSNQSLGFEVKLTPLERSSLKSSMDILDAFAVYLEAISNYTSAPDTPIAGALQGAIHELEVIDGKIKLLPQGVSSKLAQSVAVTNLIAYFEKLKNNSSDARAIKKIIESDGAAQTKNLLAVAAEADKIYTFYVSSMSSTLTNVLGDYYNQNVNSKDFDTTEKRQVFLTSLFKQKQLDNQIHISSSPGSVAIRKFVDAHEKLRNAISGNYSDEQRSFIADENIKQLKEGLQHLAGAVQFAASIAL